MRLPVPLSLAGVVLAVACDSSPSGRFPMPAPSRANPGPVLGAQQLLAVDPSKATAGSPDLTLAISGNGFMGDPQGPHDAVVWTAGGVDHVLATTFVSSSHLTAIAPGSLMQAPATVEISVWQYDDAGDTQPSSTSHKMSFFVILSMGQVISIQPTTAQAGHQDLTLSITGTGFTEGPLLRITAVWVVDDASTSLATTLIDASHLTAVIPADLLKQPLTAGIYVKAADPMDDDSGVSKTDAVGFTVTPAPAAAAAPRP